MSESSPLSDAFPGLQKNIRVSRRSRSLAIHSLLVDMRLQWWMRLVRLLSDMRDKYASTTLYQFMLAQLVDGWVEGFLVS